MKVRTEAVARVETKVETVWFLTADQLTAQVGWFKLKPVLKSALKPV